ncbi:RNA polymerase, sigma subunit, SigZ [Chitinophaga jiangningensis]|uniref:RNA polymerase sigma factor SigZ n=1 Tax=Chitinophaga jiangningensis TaxID=1419482 RepID=A0A1M7IXJ2_9BACT|nr:RNA polymerase sigma factor SigZ [Chitinophaga jiangningensis]SHM45418.1 RNA polymerase, sigma subunit, SigZ [Chitinophaga jiangningensis]
MQTPASNIWEQFSRELEQFICKQMGYDADCQDLLQELFLKIYINMPKVKAAGNIRAYLYRMARNAIMDHHRCNRQATTTQFPELADEQKHSQVEYVLADCLRPMIDTLPEIYRQALIITEIQGHTQKQYAEMSGISLSGAKSRVQRARELLKALILKCCQYEFDKYGNILSCCNNAVPTKMSC